jgi:hypothetical protein
MAARVNASNKAIEAFAAGTTVAGVSVADDCSSNERSLSDHQRADFSKEPGLL